MAGKPGNDVVGDAEDHHRHEPDQVHVEMGGAIYRPRRVHGHRDAERNTKAEPHETGFEKRLDEPIHHSAPRVSGIFPSADVGGAALVPGRGVIVASKTSSWSMARMPWSSFGSYATTSPWPTALSASAPLTTPAPASTVRITVDALRCGATACPGAMRKTTSRASGTSWTTLVAGRFAAAATASAATRRALIVFIDRRPRA